MKTHTKNKEVWVNIKGYEGLYEISNLGRIRTIPRERYNGFGKHWVDSIIRKPQMSNKGYHILRLTKDGVTKNYRVHRLVAQHFIPNPNNYKIINHINEIKTDNRVENLEWCTQQYNLEYGNTRLRQSIGQSIPVVKCDKNGNIIKKYDSMISVKDDGFNNGCVGMCCSGERQSHGGYKWRYADDN